MKTRDKKRREVEEIFQDHGGMMRTKEILEHGIHPRILYRMRDEGLLERINRGVYRLAFLPPLGNPDLVAVAKRAPQCVICLISALYYHGITTQVPHEVYLAVKRGAWLPDIDYPPVRSYRFAVDAFENGIEEHNIDGVKVRLYSPEKTLVDCFKYRNKLGLDIFLEALKFYSEKKSVRVNDLLNYAKLCRVEKIIRPYLEAVL